MSRETGSRRFTSPRKLSNPAPGTCLFLILGCCIREVKPRAFHHLQAGKLYKPSQSMLKYGRLSCSEALCGEGEGLLSQALCLPPAPGPGTGTSPFHEVNPSETESVAACRVPCGDPPSGKISAWHQSGTSVVSPSPQDKNPDAAQRSSSSAESAPPPPSSHHSPHLPGLLKLSAPSTLTTPGPVSAFRPCPGTSASPAASLPPALPLPNYVCLCVHFPLLPSF